MVPALGLGAEPPEGDVMEQPPRKRKDRLLNQRIILKGFMWYGMIEVVLSMAAYFYVNLTNG